MVIYVRDESGVLQTLRIPAYKGDKGEAGITPNVQIGDVITLESGQQATITRRGDDENPIFDFAIPKGENGEDGIFVGRIEDAPSHAQIVVNDDASPYDLFFENANIDYMGKAHDSLKKKADSDIEYLLRKFGTQHYEGSSITANDTYQKQVKSAMFKGNTLVNILGENEFPKTLSTYGSADFIVGQEVTTSTTYTIVANLENVPDSDNLIGLVLNGGRGTWGSNTVETKNGINSYLITTNTIESNPDRVIRVRGLGTTVKWVMIFKGDYTKQEIPYFEGMQSTKSPVLTTTGKNLFNYKSIVNTNKGVTITFNNSQIDCSGTYTSSNLWTTHPLSTPIKLRKGDYYYSIFGIEQETVYFTTSDGEKVYTGRRTFNTDIELVSIHFGLTKDKNYDGVTFKIQIEEGNAATSYEPYKSNILTVNEDVTLRGIGNVCDTLDLLTGEFIKRIETRPYQQGDESNAEVLTDKVNTVYKLAQPITTKIDLNNQKVYSYDGTTYYTTSSLDRYPAPILSIDVPTNTTKMIARQREEIEHQEQKLQEQEEVQNVLIESQLAWFEDNISTLELTDEDTPSHIQKLYELTRKRKVEEE